MVGDYKLVTSGALTVAGILYGCATLLDTYAKAGILTGAAIALGCGVWGILSYVEQSASASAKLIGDIVKDTTAMNEAVDTIVTHNVAMDETVREIAKSSIALNESVAQMSRQFDTAGEGFNAHVNRLENAVSSITDTNKTLQVLAKQINDGFAAIQTEFRNNAEFIKETHQNIEQSETATCKAIRTDFQAIRENIQDMYEKQMSLFKETFNTYAQGTMEQIDVYHDDMRDAIATLSRDNENYTQNVNMAVDTLLKKLHNTLQDQTEDLTEKYQVAYDLMKSQPELLKQMKDELIAVQKRQQDFNEQDLRLMERMLSGK